MFARSGRPLLPVLLGCLLAAGAVQAAGVYKWTDDKGNVHYSDKPPPGGDKAAQGNVKAMQLQDAYTGVSVVNKLPIRNPRGDGGPALTLARFTLQLDAANSRNVTVGRNFYGANCEKSADLLWNEGMLDLKGRQAELLVSDRFDKAGYSLSYQSSLGLYNLEAELVRLKIDLCTGGRAIGGSGSRTYMKLRWTLKARGSDEPLFRATSEGAFDGWNTGEKDSTIRALANATDNLLGDRAFIDALAGTAPRSASAATGGRRAAAAEDFDEYVNVAFERGIGSSTFRQRSTQLLAGAVTIATARGHGSGVIIDPAGFVLTNAHVVGQERAVRVIVGDRTLDGRVVKRDSAADVALVQLRGEGLSAVTVASEEPRPGDPLYVIGTPLDVKLSHTVTQGILSAVREEAGRRLFQTDASINPGNSGGPVFDAAGELVALSVAGLFNRQGASLNVNYLIPIEAALKAMKVAPREVP
jgi:serine protease Do